MRLASRPLTAATVGLALLLGACAPEVSASEAAVVDGHAISRGEVEEPVRDALNRSGAVEGLDADERAQIVEPLQRRVLSLLIQAAVIRDLADEEGIEVAPGRVDERFEADAASVGGEEELADLLAQQGLSLGLYRDVLLPTQELVEGMRELVADDLESTVAREARHILVESDAEAQDILRELAGGADFGELAEERSTDPGSAAQGGELGPRERGFFVDAFDEAVWASAIGEIVGPVQTQFGFHVIEVLDETEVTPDDLSPEERRQRLDVLLDQLLEARFAAAEVTVSSRFGVWNALTGTVEPGPEVGSDG